MDWEKYDATVGIQVTKGSKTIVCSGVLLNPTVILTAAHCVKDMTSARATNQRIFDSNTEWIPIEKGLMHPGYNGNKPGASTDLGIFFLKAPLTGVHYPVRAAFDFNLKCERIGYGGRWKKNVRTWITSIPKEYQGTSVKVKDSYGHPGDSGGPVFQIHHDGAKLVGIHTGRALDGDGDVVDISFVQLTPDDLWAWVASHL